MKFDDIYNSIIRENSSEESDNYDEKELEAGVKDETEEHDVKEGEAEKIAKQHLDKDPEYYSKLKEAGID